MKPREWGVLEVCLRLTCGGRNKLFLDGRKMAERFSGIKKDAIYGAIKALKKAGWLIRVGRRDRDKKTQRYDNGVYHVLTHDQWTRKHGTKKCSKVIETTSRENPNGPVVESRTEPVVISREPVGFSREPVVVSREPVVESRHSSVKHSSVKESPMKEISVEAGHGPDLVSSPRPLSVEEQARQAMRHRRAEMRAGLQ